MKKLHIAILIIIVLIAVCAIITIPKMVEIYNKNNEVLITSEYTEQHSKLTDYGDTLIYTIYKTKGNNPVKQEIIHTFENGIVSSSKLVQYCETINWAKTLAKTDYGDKDKIIQSRDKNVITYEFKEFEKKTKEEVIENFKKNDKNLIIISEN